MVASLVGAGVGALASIVPSLIGGSKNKETHLYKDAGGEELLKALQNVIKGNGNWKDLLPALGSLSDNVAEYANSAYNYWLEDQAFERQVKYNFEAMAKQYKYDVAMQNRSYNQSMKLQNAQNEWSKMMSDTSHQREVTDLRSAGLNPILSANGGANAYSSGSAIIQGNTPNSLPVQKPNYAQSVNALVEAKRVKNETAETRARIDKLAQETKNLQFTKEGLAGQIADMIEGRDYEKNITGGVVSNNGLTYSNPLSNALRGFASHIKQSDIGSKILGVLNNINSGEHKSYQWKSMNTVNDLLNSIKGSNSSNDIIHTKYGDLIDIDNEIRTKYNVGKKIRSHR